MDDDNSYTVVYQIISAIDDGIFTAVYRVKLLTPISLPPVDCRHCCLLLATMAIAPFRYSALLLIGKPPLYLSLCLSLAPNQTSRARALIELSRPSPTAAAAPVPHTPGSFVQLDIVAASSHSSTNRRRRQNRCRLSSSVLPTIALIASPLISLSQCPHRRNRRLSDSPVLTSQHSHCPCRWN